MLLFTLIAVRRYLFSPFHTLPKSEDPSMRGYCRGWACNYQPENVGGNDKFNGVIGQYRNGTLKKTLHHKMQKFVKHNFTPAYCLSGYGYLTGVGGYSINHTKSFEYLLRGSSDGFWACDQILAFHPLVNNTEEYLEKSISKGAILSMVYKINKIIDNDPNNYEKAFDLIYHLSTAASGSWFRRHKGGGLPFASYVKAIATGSRRKKSDAYKKLNHLAQSGHLPAALWIADSIINGRTTVTTKNEISRILYKHVINAQWKVDVMEIVSSRERFHKTESISLYARLGDEAADAFLSYPNLLR